MSANKTTRHRTLLSTSACPWLAQVNQKLGAKLISKLKHPVETAGNGQVAIDMILQDREKYGLVLMDCQVSVLRDDIRKMFRVGMQSILNTKLVRLRPLANRP